MQPSKCLDCGSEIDWDNDGGFLWEGEVFCSNHDPESAGV